MERSTQIVIVLVGLILLQTITGSPVSNPQVGIYGAYLFSHDVPEKNQMSLQAIQTSGFTTVMLASFHAHEGTIYFNDGIIVSSGVFQPTYNYLIPLLSQLRRSVRLILSIGPFQSDYSAIVDYPISSLNLKVLVDVLQFDGFDLDYEGDQGTTGQDLVVNMTQLLVPFRKPITFCPFKGPSFFVACMQELYGMNNRTQPVTGWNLQCYSGGSANDVAMWQVVIERAATSIGVNNPKSFIAPGLGCANCNSNLSWGALCPSDMKGRFQQYASMGITQGWMWDTDSLFYCMGQSGCGPNVTAIDYYNAIFQGLTSSP
eukprot:TRINITY_DN2121_c0_g1_i1.p1 TRINITY_DN2121_c0_g1~~TRINITY_DN2121_c0_g1_i1.p1  ORF type:complete len:316 (+),score=28.64 TRINITY_DN2121_c0_g1_i1:38-985(+)